MKKIILLVFIVLLFSVSVVNAAFIPLAANSAKWIKEDIEGYGVVTKFSDNPNDFAPSEHIIYKDSDIGSYEAYVADFNSAPYDSEELDSWITFHTKDALAKKIYGNNTVYIDKDNRSAFWRSGEFYVRIGAKIEMKSSLPDQIIKPTGIFPEDIVKEYLNIYPSDCNSEHCRLFDAIKEQRRQEEHEKLKIINQELKIQREALRPKINITERNTSQTGNTSERKGTGIPEYVEGEENWREQQESNITVDGGYNNTEEPPDSGKKGQDSEKVTSVLYAFVRSLMERLGLVYD